MSKKFSFGDYIIIIFLNLIPSLTAFYIGMAFMTCIFYWQQPKMFEFIQKFWMSILLITIIGAYVWHRQYKEQLENFKDENLDFSLYKNVTHFIDWKRRKYNTTLKDEPKK